ncbi:MAG: hypothetical protein ACK4Y4_03300 [Brevundimonas sp.]
MDVEISKLIESVVRDRFGDGVISSVRVTEDTDHDGDRIFAVTVVFEGKGPLDDEKTATVIRHIRHKLREHREETFPIISFMSKNDAAGISAEAA